MSESSITVEVAFALPKQQKIVEVLVPEGTTMDQVVKQSGLEKHFDGIEDFSKYPMGVFGKSEPRPHQRVMQDGERIELYRPLIADPKLNRKKKASRS